MEEYEDSVAVGMYAYFYRQLAGVGEKGTSPLLGDHVSVV